MTKTLLSIAAIGALAVAAVAAQRGGGEGAVALAPSGPNYPAWAYATTPPPPPGTPRPPAPPEDTSVHHVAGTTRAFTVEQITDTRGPADWFPEDHPVMPAIVAVARPPAVRSC